MEKFVSIQILGLSAGIPTKERTTSCTIISTSFQNFMIDCGEGAYRKYIQNGYDFSLLNYIFITHMHPDHISGLVPILFYKNISNQLNDIKIIGPAELKDYIDFCLKKQDVVLKYNYQFYRLETQKDIAINDININWLLLDHKISSWGYKFSVNSKSIVFITDSRICQNSIILSQNASILIHEATFSDSDKKLAFEKFHSTPEEVVELALKSNVDTLILTHFSSDLSTNYLKNISYKRKKCVIFDNKLYL